jgi:hypothetical protein
MWHHPLMPETLRREFNLPHSGLSSRERGLVLEDAALAWAGRDGQRRLDFDDIALIKMEAEIDGDNPFAQCDIVFRDETRLRVEVTNDANHYDDALEYRAFLAAFFDQLGPERRARIDFIYGPSALKRTIQIAVSAAFTAAFIGLIIFQLFSSDLWRDNNWLLILGAAHGFVMRRPAVPQHQEPPDAVRALGDPGNVAANVESEA